MRIPGRQLNMYTCANVRRIRNVDIYQNENLVERRRGGLESFRPAPSEKGHFLDQ